MFCFVLVLFLFVDLQKMFFFSIQVCSCCFALFCVVVFSSGYLLHFALHFSSFLGGRGGRSFVLFLFVNLIGSLYFLHCKQTKRQPWQKRRQN